MLDFPPDITFAIQFIGFFVLYFALDRLLFKPYAAVLARRDERTLGASLAAETDQHEVHVLRARIDESMCAARAEAQVQADAVRREARAEETALYERAKNAAAARLAELSSVLDRECSAARGALKGDAQALAEQMASVVLEGKA